MQIVKVKENNKNKFIYVCSDCQKQDGWIEKGNIIKESRLKKVIRDHIRANLTRKGG